MLYTYIKILDFGFARNGVDKKEKEMKGKDEVKKWYKYTVKIKNEIKNITVSSKVYEKHFKGKIWTNDGRQLYTSE